MLIYFIKKNIVLFSCFVFSLNTFYAQQKTPRIFKFQNKYLSKQVHKHLQKDTFFKTSKATIHVYYSTSQVKPYLLLLHGMGANAKTNWYKQIKGLSKHYNLIVPDLIYFGESKSDTTCFSPEFQVQQINEVVKKITSQKINVMGFSYGGLCAAMYNNFYFNEINKLIIIDGPVKFYTVSLADSLAKSVGLNSMNELIVPSTVQQFNGMKKAVLSKKIPITKRLKKKTIAYYFDKNRKERIAQMTYLRTNEKRYSELNYGIDSTKTLLIWGKKDGVVPLEIGEKLNQKFKTTTRLFVFKKAKHDVHFRNSKKLNLLVNDFLAN